MDLEEMRHLCMFHSSETTYWICEHMVFRYIPCSYLLVRLVDNGKKAHLQPRKSTFTILAVSEAVCGMTPIVLPAGAASVVRPARIKRASPKRRAPLAAASVPSFARARQRKRAVATHAISPALQPLFDMVSAVPLLGAVIRNDATLVIGEHSSLTGMRSALAPPPIQPTLLRHTNSMAAT